MYRFALSGAHSGVCMARRRDILRHSLLRRVCCLTLHKRSMTLEQQVISLSLAKRLKELGVKQGSIYYWRGVSNNTAIEPENWFYSWRIVRSDETVPEHSNNARLRIYPAFTVAELGEMLPRYIQIQGFSCELEIIRSSVWRFYYGAPESEYGIKFTAPTDADEAESRGLFLAYLLESKLLDL